MQQEQQYKAQYDILYMLTGFSICDFVFPDKSFISNWCSRTWTHCPGVMRITITQSVTCRAHALDDNPQKGVNPDQTQYNPGFRLGCPENIFSQLKKKNKSGFYWDVEIKLGACSLILKWSYRLDIKSSVLFSCMFFQWPHCIPLLFLLHRHLNELCFYFVNLWLSCGSFQLMFWLTFKRFIRIFTWALT